MTDQILAGLSRISTVLRHEAWAMSGPERLSPTQAQILTLLAARTGLSSRTGLSARTGESIRPSMVARHLAITAATASDAIKTLEGKGLLKRSGAPEDGRVQHLHLTAKGRRTASRLMQWPDFLLSAADTLSAGEQAVFRVALTKMIHTLQREGRIPVSRMCASCRFFRPHAHEGSPQPHHCDYVDAPFGNVQLRLDCAEFEAADEARQDDAWNRFLHPGPLLEKPGTGMRSVQRHQKENTP